MPRIKSINAKFKNFLCRKELLFLEPFSYIWNGFIFLNNFSIFFNWGWKGIGQKASEWLLIKQSNCYGNISKRTLYIHIHSLNCDHDIFPWNMHVPLFSLPFFLYLESIPVYIFNIFFNTVLAELCKWTWQFQFEIFFSG